MPNDKNIENNEAQQFIEAPQFEYNAEEDIVTENIQDTSFSTLLQRFGTAEEDESIRNEDFNPLIAGRMTKKAADAQGASSFRKETDASAENPIPLQNEFGLADSAFDNDAISFDDIDIGDFEAIESDLPVTGNPSAKGYNTNTKVVFVDKSVDDGIQRNSDEDVSSVFSSDE